MTCLFQASWCSWSSGRARTRLTWFRPRRPTSSAPRRSSSSTRRGWRGTLPRRTETTKYSISSFQRWCRSTSHTTASLFLHIFTHIFSAWKEKFRPPHAFFVIEKLHFILNLYRVSVISSVFSNRVVSSNTGMSLNLNTIMPLKNLRFSIYLTKM